VHRQRAPPRCTVVVHTSLSGDVSVFIPQQSESAPAVTVTIDRMGERDSASSLVESGRNLDPSIVFPTLAVRFPFMSIRMTTANRTACVLIAVGTSATDVDGTTVLGHGNPCLTPCRTVLTEIFASNCNCCKTWRKHRDRNTLSYYQLGVGTELKRPYTKRRGSGRLFYLRPAVSTHEVYRAPPPRLSSVLTIGGYHENQREEPHWFWPSRCVRSGLNLVRTKNGGLEYIERLQRSRGQWADGRPSD